MSTSVVMSLARLCRLLAPTATSILAGCALTTLSHEAGFEVVGLAGTLAAGCIAALIYDRRRTSDAFSVLSFGAIFYLLAFCAGGLYFWITPGVRFSDVIDHHDLIWALEVANVSWYLFAAGYFANPLRALSRVIPVLRQTPNVSSIGRTVLPLEICGWAARAEILNSGRYFHTIATGSVVSTGSSWIIASLALLPTLAAAFVGAHHYQHVRSYGASGLRWTYVTLIVVEIAWYIPTGERGSLVGIALMLAIVRYYGLRRRVPVAILVTTVLSLMFVVFPFGLLYRGNNDVYQTHASQALRAAVSTMEQRDIRQWIGAGTYATFSRFSDVTSLAAVHHRGRSALPMKRAQTLIWSMEGFVPRALLKTKDNPGLFGNTFGRAYGIVAHTDRITSIAVTQPGDFYLNFGFLGIMLGMPVVGAFYRLLNDYFKERSVDPASLAIYSVVAWPIINGHEVTLAVGLVGVLKATILLSCVLLIINRFNIPRREVRLRSSFERESSPRGAYAGPNRLAPNKPLKFGG